MDTRENGNPVPQEGVALSDEALEQLTGGANYNALLHPMDTLQKLAKPFVEFGRALSERIEMANNPRYTD